MDRINNLDKIQYTLKKLIKLATDNSKVTLLVPAILGGLWQLYDLYKIDPAYLRFFSTSQLITDGIIILIILALFFIIITLYYGFRDIIEGLKTRVEDTFKGVKKRLCIVAINYLESFVVFGVPLFLYYSIKMQRIDSFSFILIGIIPIIFLIILYLKDIFKSKKSKPKKRDKNATKNKKSLTVPIFLIAILIGVLISIYQIFHVEFRLPSNLINTAYIECDVKKTYPLSFKEIVYYNDKYIFVSIVTENGNKMKVYDFKDLLKQSDCAISK